MTKGWRGKLNGAFTRTLAMVVITGVVGAPREARAQDGRVISGSHSMIVISLKSAGGPASHCSNATLASMYFTDPRSVSAYYAENSYGLMRISGTVTGPHVVNVEQGWSPASVADEADAAVTAAGVSLSLYSSKVYILPKEADPNPIQSSWGGRSNRGRIWIRDHACSSTSLVAHELGHHLGMNHASTPADDYGDYSSTMAGRFEPTGDPSTWNNLPHYNAPGKIAAGWLPASAVQTVTADGTSRVASFRVASVETVPLAGQIQALKIEAGADGTDYYYVSYRQPVGFSSVLTPQYAATTSITRWNGAMGARTCLLANLADGQSFDASGLIVFQSSHDAVHAYITVFFGTPPSNVRVTCP